MQPTRRARLASLIQDELSRVVPREVKDPRIPSVTFTQVQVSADGSVAKVFVMLLGKTTGNDKFKREMKECLAGLASASGFLKRHLATCLDTRLVPQLVFEEDRGLENTLRVHELLKQISQENDPEKNKDKK